MGPLLRFADVVDAITRGAGKLAAALLLVLVALVFYNALGRYAFGGSAVWAQELEWHLLLVCALIGVSVLMREHGHVRVDMLYERLPERVRHAFDAVSMLLGAAVAAMLIRYSLGFVDSSWSTREGSADPGGLPGRYLLKSAVPALLGLLAAQCLANAVRHVEAFRHPGDGAGHGLSGGDGESGGAGGIGGDAEGGR